MNVTQEVVSRCLALIPLIREHQGIPLSELAKLARIPEEQIADELGSVLLMCGVPPYFPHDFISFLLEKGRVHIRFADHFRRPVSLNPLEAIALKLACENAVPPGKAIPKVVGALLRKIESAMSPEQRRQYQNLAKRLVVRDSSEAAGGATARLAMAGAERRAVRIEYLASGKPEAKERTVHPYGLIERDGHWYLVARDSLREKVIPFRIDRILRFKVLTERFEIEPGFRLEQFSFGALVGDGDPASRARVRCRGVSARWLREVASPGSLRDAGDEVIWEPTVGSEEGFARFILGFGGDAEVLEPLGLRAKMATSLKAVIAANGAAAAAG